MSKPLSKEEAFEELVLRIKGCATLRQVSLAYVRYALACFGENKVVTAARIGVDRRTIQRWLPRDKQAPTAQDDDEPGSGLARSGGGPHDEAPSSLVVETSAEARTAEDDVARSLSRR